MRATVTFTCEHAEDNRAPFDGAVAEFLKLLGTRGYQGTCEVDWQGSPLRTSPDSRSASNPGQILREDAPARVSSGASSIVDSASLIVDEGGGIYIPSRTFESKGGGYYNILEGGEVVDTVRGLAAAEAAVA